MRHPPWALVRLVLGSGSLAVLACTSVGSSPGDSRSMPPPTIAVPSPALSRLAPAAREVIGRYLSPQQTSTLGALAAARSYPAGFKSSLALSALTDPWAGLPAQEAHGLRIAQSALAGADGLAGLINELEAGLDRSAPQTESLTVPAGDTPDEHLAFITNVLSRAARWRERAVQHVSSDDRRFLFEHAHAMTDLFIPQVATPTERDQSEAEGDRRFSQLTHEELDYAALLAAARELAALANPAWVRRLAGAYAHVSPTSPPPNGVTGTVLAVRETAFGLIVVGGPGRNSYDVGRGIALIVDVGGDDIYRGAVAAPSGPEEGNRVVLDLDGNDAYHPAPLGLATGRLSVGLLWDLAGDDVYHLADGSGGTGFAGIGLLLDGGGNDRYEGTRMTLGAAIGGLGLVLETAGDDTYSSHGYALGFGGPSGVGAVIDLSGNDRYACGDKYPSTYNAVETPTASPGDPQFQYDCFGLGVGSGKRIYSTLRSHLLYGLAGGFGLLIDCAGDDRYRSANFSQGAGYFFGVGVKLDLDGNDEHAAARYGLAAAAHFGVGLFTDFRGDDRYVSAGPVYTGGAAWDLSVALAVDAEQGGDVYDLSHSTGLGIADHMAWGLFIDEGGNDVYRVPTGLGHSGDHSVGAFADLAGMDDYALAPQTDSVTSRNGRTQVDPTGGLFYDR